MTLSKSILVVEDNEENADMLCRRLELRGFHVSLARDGVQAVARARDALPDLILMDLSLPEIDGWEATRRIKYERTTSSIPVIALTAHAMVEDRQRARDAGCNAFETKPVDLDKLLVVIDRFLGTGATAVA